jgi:hypothetical protein
LERLERDGVDAFAASYDELTARILARAAPAGAP